MNTEPSADLRHTASIAWQFLVALELEGFTRDEAMALVGAYIGASGGGWG